MKVACYLVVQGRIPKYGPDREFRREAGTVKLTKTKPHTAKDEIAVKLDIEIPDALYFRPTLEAKISVADNASYGAVISTEVTDNIAEIIKQQTGFTVHISAATDEGGSHEE